MMMTGCDLAAMIAPKISKLLQHFVSPWKRDTLVQKISEKNLLTNVL